ncbi:hypothetical protein BaRGS_00022357 [Batillaria attramentaria]|uniref:Uncharacterized protein n=1 Tax=Batillaria attramentaria TaxID=370345 RepID=A0ABD0KGW3_9CAEN
MASRLKCTFLLLPAIIILMLGTSVTEARRCDKTVSGKKYKLQIGLLAPATSSDFKMQKTIQENIQLDWTGLHCFSSPYYLTLSVNDTLRIPSDGWNSIRTGIDNGLQRQGADEGEVPNVIIGPFYTNLAMGFDWIDMSRVQDTTSWRTLVEIRPPAQEQNLAVVDLFNNNGWNSAVMVMPENAADNRECQNLASQMLSAGISLIPYTVNPSLPNVKASVQEVLRNALLFRQLYVIVCSPRDSKDKLIELVLIEVESSLYMVLAIFVFLSMQAHRFEMTINEDQVFVLVDPPMASAKEMYRLRLFSARCQLLAFRYVEPGRAQGSEDEDKAVATDAAMVTTQALKKYIVDQVERTNHFNASRFLDELKAVYLPYGQTGALRFNATGQRVDYKLHLYNHGGEDMYRKIAEWSPIGDSYLTRLNHTGFDVDPKRTTQSGIFPQLVKIVVVLVHMQLSTVTDTQLSIVTDTQLSTVTDTQLSTVTDTQLSTITDTQLSTVTNTQLSTVTDTQLSTVTDAQLSTINKHEFHPTVTEEPFVMIKKELGNRLEGVNRFEGFTIDLIARLARGLNFDYDIYISPNNAYGGPRSDGTWTGMVGEVLVGNATLAAGAISITSTREQVIDFSLGVLSTGVNILVRKPEESLTIFQFLEPFTPELWMAIVGASAFISLVFFLMDYTNGDDRRFTLRETIWFCVGTLLKRGTDFAPVPVSQRILTAGFTLFVLITVSTYTANMAAFLTTKNLGKSIDSFEALAADDSLACGTVANSATMNFLSQGTKPVFQRLWDKAKGNGLVADASEGRRRVEGGGYAFIFDYLINSYSEMKYCKTKAVAAPILIQEHGIGMPAGAAFKTSINIELLKLKEDGVLQSLKKKWWDDKRECESAGSNTRDEQMEFGLQHMAGVFIVGLLGLGASLALFLLKKFYLLIRPDKANGNGSTNGEKFSEKSMHPPPNREKEKLYQGQTNTSFV